MGVCETPVACLLVYTAVVVVSVVGCVFTAVVLYIHYQHRKYAHLPSPPRDGFFQGHLPSLFKYFERGQSFAQALADITDEYGPVSIIFMFHVPFIQLCDSEAVKDTLFNEAHTKPLMMYRSFQAVFNTRFLGTGLVSQLDPVKHAKRRALLNPMFTRKYLVSFVGQFNASADLLIEKLSKKADGKTEVVMLEELNKTTLDVIAKVAFGQDLEVIEDDNASFNKAISVVLKGIRDSFNLGVHWSPFPAARKFRQEVRDGIHFLRETGRRCIEQRLQAIRKQEDVPNDILTQILKEYIQLEDTDDSLEMEDLIDEFVTLFFGGQETTANLLSFCLIELGNHPEIMHRLKTEVDAVLGDKDRMEPSDIGKLTYMMQVLKETLRLWPPVTGTTRQLGHEITVQGFKVPKGTMVSVNSYVMSRMEEYFHDPLQFDPDRFKTSDDKPQYAYFPFSLGSRNCIGQQFAMIEARVLLARLLHKFHFDLVPGQGYLINDSVTLKPAGGCRNYLRLVEDS